jgi:hypothetical protein
LGKLKVVVLRLTKQNYASAIVVLGRTPCGERDELKYLSK